jgi:hypothetical protein
MNRPKNLYRIKQKLAVFGYRFMPFYSEEWEQYLMETSEYYIEAYQGPQQVVSIDKEVSGERGGIANDRGCPERSHLAFSNRDLDVQSGKIPAG